MHENIFVRCYMDIMLTTVNIAKDNHNISCIGEHDTLNKQPI